MRRGVVGALASGDARVRRACGAVRKGARAEAGWCRAPHARAEGFMGVRLRTFTHGLHELVARSGSVGMSHVCVEHCVASPRLRNGLFWQYCQIAQGLPPPLGAPFRQTAPPLDAVVQSSPDRSARPPSPLHPVQPRLHNAAQVGVGGSMRSVAATVQWGGVSAA